MPPLAYLTTEYPKVSHTFIRREIVELERMGYDVQRFAIRGAGGAVSDPADRREAERTFVCLDQPAWRFAWAMLATKMTRMGRFTRAFRTALSMSRRSDRGLVRHIAYLGEACLLRREMQRRGVEHVHVHFGTNAAAVARLIALLGGPGYSMTIHGPDELDAPIGFSLGEKIADARFTVAISDFCSAQLRRWSAPEHWPSIHVVHCTVDESFLEEPEPITPGTETFLCIGRLSAQKGHLVLIEAMAELRRGGAQAVGARRAVPWPPNLVLAGDGEMRDLVEAHIARYGLGEVVKITGWVEEATVRQLLRECRALVQPSFAEGLPVVMMEALARGRPVIATAIAGVPELVRHGESGWIVTAGNVEELVAAMRTALATPEARLDEMGRAGRCRVIQRHRAATEAAKLAALFEQHVGAAATGAQRAVPGRRPS